jgi:sugar phosphate isomerase/epimerase
MLKIALRYVLPLVFVVIAGAVLFGSMLTIKTADKQQVAENKKKVVFVAGTRSHGYGSHEHLAGCMLLARLLEENTRNIVTKVYSEGWPDSNDAFEEANAIVMFSDDPSSDVIHPEEGAKNTVAGLKELALLAERHGVDIYMEHLNSRVPDDTFRGHPGYQGDDIDYCADIIRQVGSPRVKLLFDIYHVQIMNGDIISRIREYGTDLIGHIHTAGVPGRVELDSCQELQYAPIMQSLLDIGYNGYVGHEFIPTRDPLTGLREAIFVCDV